MPQVKNSPQRVAHKGIGCAVLLLTAVFGGLFCALTSKNVYAAEMCGSDDSVRYDALQDEGLVFNQDTDRSTIDLYDEGDKKVLKLNNYSGGDICISVQNDILVLELVGENRIIGDQYYGLSVESAWRTVVRGGGSLEVAAEDPLKTRSEFYMESGTINLHGQEINDYCEISPSSISIMGGHFSSRCGIDEGVNFFYQEDGVFEMIADANDESGSCMSMGFAVFNGGTFSLDCKSGYAMMLGYAAGTEDILADATIEEDGVMRKILYEGMYGILPNHGAVLFNAGDVTIKGAEGALVLNVFDENGAIEEYLAEKGVDYFVMIADGMTIEPDVSMKSITVNPNMAYFSFTSGDVLTEDNIIKSLHIFGNAASVAPKADGEKKDIEKEENPNTADYHLFSIISAIVVSVVAGAFIIIDLRRRIASLRGQIEKEG